mmetsp:Transcript_23996/g.80941  ORF Transcript_23996/g.80941 Transcript_23996/m.80941 type:complete len:218 (-) Transcript_23996:33-686(-)
MAAATARPEPMAPLSASGPSNHSRISSMSANGERLPAWPPAPCATATRPSAPFATALRANALLMTSWKTKPPYECTASLMSSRAPRDVMTMGTRCFTISSMSSMTRLFDLCTIWFTANGAAPGTSSRRALMSTSHSSSVDSRPAPRAFSAGNEPTMPAEHCATTNAGFDTRNSGAPITGTLSLLRSAAAIVDMVRPDTTAIGEHLEPPVCRSGAPVP